MTCKQKLSPTQAVAAFFKQLLNHGNVTKEQLKYNQESRETKYFDKITKTNYI